MSFHAPDPMRHAPMLDAAEGRAISVERELLLAKARRLVDELSGGRPAEGPLARHQALRLCEFASALVVLGKVNEGRKCHDRGVALLRELGDTALLEPVMESWK